MNPQGTLTVVLSTFNGEKYLKQLLDSVMAQTYPHVRLLIRDDGSTDGTREILAEYCQSTEVRVIHGENVGVARSFWMLLREAVPHSDYVAFCDQDDVWLPEKMSRAVGMLDESVPPSTPGLYCATYYLTDENLTVLRRAVMVRKGPSFENALVECIVTGCTAVLNAAGASLVASHVPQSPTIHDWWMYIVLSALGTVVADDFPALYYRQHGSNTVGVAANPWEQFMRRVRRFNQAGPVSIRTQMALEFKGLYGDLLDERKQSILNDFIEGRRTMFGRAGYALTGAVRRQTIPDEVIMRLLIALGKM
jgi:glycosyltransferase involved in cell wall biosynthesis